MHNSILSELFNALNIQILERQRDGLFQFIGKASQDCFQCLFPESGQEGEISNPGKHSLFLENFLVDAEIFWSEKKPGRINSGRWIEMDASGSECMFEAIALSISGKELLLIELSRYSYQAKQDLIQKGRLLSLEYERLARLEKDLKKAHGELEKMVEKRTSELLRANSNLELEIKERGQIESDLHHISSVLGKRMKELGCLYDISWISEMKGLSLESSMRKIVEIIPDGWRWPEETCARIILGDSEFRSENFRESEWQQRTVVHAHGRESGAIEVYYMAQWPEGKADPFLKEEIELMDAIAERVGNIIEKKVSEENQRQLESQLQMAQKFEAIGTLSSGIAHDFNNILSAIIGYTEIAYLHAEEGSKVKASLSKVLKAGNRATSLVHQILSFSMQREEEQRPIQVSPILKEVIKLVRASIPTTIEIRQNIQNTAGFVEADPTKIHQILMNLCTNAHHAMREKGGVLDLALAQVELAVDDKEVALHNLIPGPYLRLSVSDTGFGMDRNTMDRIFDPYFTTKEKGEGTGLGLAVVHGIVKGYGGGIIVKSIPEKGTSFHIYLPVVANVEAVTESDAARAPLPTGHERILYIDDEQVLADLGKEGLEYLGYRVVSRTSSIEALELFRKQPHTFDLIITDMTMPNMTGLVLSLELMRCRSDIPIILCTGFSEQINREIARKSGIRAFAMKPLVIEDLAKTVRKVLDG